MNGTIFRMRPQTGRAGDVVALMEEWARARGPHVPGARAAYLLRPEPEEGELVGVAVFADREAYRANAGSPEQEAWYQRLREALEADPVWEDGEVPVAAHFPHAGGG